MKRANAQGGKVMARNFFEVVRKIKEVAPEQLSRKLEESVAFWAPELAWYNLNELVNKCVEKSSEDKTAVAVYAILCDCTEAEMRARFEANNF